MHSVSWTLVFLLNVVELITFILGTLMCPSPLQWWIISNFTLENHNVELKHVLAQQS